MSGINKVILIGNLTKDPELKALPTGLSVCEFGVATSENWKDKASGERQEKVEYHNIKVFGKTAEACKNYLSKGKKVFIEGKLETRSWEKDGIKRYKTEINAVKVEFLSVKPAVNQQSASFTADEIPF